MSEHSRAPSVCSPASRLGGTSQVLMWEMSSPDEVTKVIKGVKGLKSDYYIFNSFGELQREATEHSVSAGGSSRGSALWPSPPLWRYALLFWLLCSTHNLLLVSAVFIVPHTAVFPPSALALLFSCLPTYFCCSSSGTRFHHISHTASPYWSENKHFFPSFLSFFFLFARIVMSTLTT